MAFYIQRILYKGAQKLQYMIRKMKEEDIKQVQSVAKDSWHATYEGIIPLTIQDRFLAEAYNDDMMQRRLAHSLIFVAEVDGTVVGFANYGKVNEQKEAELAAVYILPAYQGLGIGSAFLQAGIEAIDNVQKIIVEVEKENDIGKGFYLAKGFHIIAEYDNPFEGHPLKTIRLQLDVD